MQHMTIRQLRGMAAAAKTGSFSGAAQAVGLTPAAITAQLRQLEQAVGLALFERAGKKQVLTPAGQEVLTCSRRVDEAIENCRNAVAALKALDRGRVAVGAVSTAKYYVPRVLAAFSRKFPQIELRLHVANRAAIIAALADNSLDFAIMGRPPEGLAVECQPIADHPHIVIAPPDHPLAGQGQVAGRALDSETFVVREPESGTRMLMQRFFDQFGMAPKIGMEMSSNETIKQAVIAGLGIAFISAHTVAAEVEDRRLAILSVQGLPLVRQWYIVRLASKRPSPPALALEEFVARETRTYLPAPAEPRSAPSVQKHLKRIQRTKNNSIKTT